MTSSTQRQLPPRAPLAEPQNATAPDKWGPWFTANRANPIVSWFITAGGLTLLAYQRLRFYSGLSLLALIGIILAVGLVTSAGFFAQAVDQVMMERELTEYSRLTGRPPFTARVFSPTSTQVPLTIESTESMGSHVAGILSDEVGLPVRDQVIIADTGVLRLMPLPEDTRYDGQRALADSGVIYMSAVADHIETIVGAPLDDGASGEWLQVWPHNLLAGRIGLQIGDRFLLSGTTDSEPIPVEIAGIWQPLDAADAYWPSDPDQTLRDKFLVRRGDYIGHVQARIPNSVRTATWQIVLDEQAALPANARHYKTGFESAGLIIPRYLPDARITTPTASLERFVGQQTTLTVLLLGFNVPALAFLLYFLVLTSAVIAYWQRRETSLLRSRGITQSSILNFTFMEGILLFVVGLPLGLALGIGLALLMGYSVSFLAFDARPPLPVSIHGLNLYLTFGTLAVVLIAKIWTVAFATRQTVVTQAQEHARPTQAPLWYRAYLDVVLLIPTFYAYRQLSQREWLGALVQDRPEDLYQDPLLILVPGLFIISISLVAMRLFPLFMAILDRMARFLPNLTLYLAFRQLGRQSQSYINPLLLVIVSLGLGVYTLSMAASMNYWLEDRVYYQNGADLAFRPYSENEALSAAEGSPGADWIPPVDEYESVAHVEHGTRVGDYQGEVVLSGGTRISARFMGIDRVDFAHAAWYRHDFAREPLNSLMNRLASSPEAVLVAQDFLTEHNLRIGDTIGMLVIADIGASTQSQFVIAGVYEHFPTVYPEQVTVIGNLEHIFSFFGITMPHSIWLRLDDPTLGQEVLTQIPQVTGVDTMNARDTYAQLTTEQAQLERVGVFGTLSVSFFAAALMAALGLLTYSYASLNERLYQFSVLRAIGLKRSEIVGQVGLEYAILTAFGAILGAGCGTFAARLFVPLFRVSGELGAPLPPILPILAEWQIVPLSAAFAGIMILLQIVIISSAFYRRLFEALRLGHHG
ncbi:MAG: ABC transporter permease [Litorilinea sp.]